MFRAEQRADDNLSFVQMNSVHGEFLGVLDVVEFCVSRALSTVTPVHIHTRSHDDMITPDQGGSSKGK